MEVPELSGILTDFISQLLNLDVRLSRSRGRAGLNRIAKMLEKEVMHGTIAVRAKPNAYPEIFYQAGRLEVPLFRSSSMISELAPVVLYLRSVLWPGHQLIIEEPEAHLHPQSQRAFARALVQLEAENVATLLTTHSDYLLSELSNMIRHDAIRLRHEERLNVEGQAESLAADEVPRNQPLAEKVASYLFSARSPSQGTLVRRMQVSLAEGIPEDEFGRVAEQMYQESVDLQYELMSSEEQ
jgi:predicted ATPase